MAVGGFRLIARSSWCSCGRQLGEVRPGLFQFFIHEGIENAAVQATSNRSCRYRVADEFSGCGELAEIAGCDRAKASERFAQGSRFVWATNGGGEVLCSGWLAKTPERFFFSELGVTLCNCRFTMLYDFVTPELFRRKGNYVKLLDTIVTSEAAWPYVISAEVANIGSIRGIVRAGFKPISLLSVFRLCSPSTSRP